MSGPRRRKFVGWTISRVAWHGGRGRQRSRWALIIALGLALPRQGGSQIVHADLVEEGLVADLEPPGGLHSVPAELFQHLLNPVALRLAGGVAPDLLEPDAGQPRQRRPRHSEHPGGIEHR